MAAKMNHSFDVDMAVKLGMAEAVLLEHLRFWVLKNAANGKHLHDGRYWTYNSAKAFAELFPYLSEDKIQRSLKKMEAVGAVLAGYHSQDKRDRTRWYSVADAYLPAKQAHPFRKIAESTFRESAECTIHTDINTVNKGAGGQALPPATPNGDSEFSEGFSRFWAAWPKSARKGAKGKCYGVWVKAKAESQTEAIVAHVEYLKTTEAWTSKGGQYIQAPLVYLNQRTWEGAEDVSSDKHDVSPSALGVYL